MRVAIGAPYVEVISGKFYRMKFKSEAAEILQPAKSPEGRWHHSGQKALYLSETTEGTYIASRMYIRDDDPEREIYPLAITDARVLSLRNDTACRHYEIDASQKHCMWHELRAIGKPSPTWSISDAVRHLGFDGFLCPSRSRPDLTHLTLFRWNTEGAPIVSRA